MLDITTLGYVAAFCTTCSFVPQVLHILKTGDTASISLAMYSLFVFGVFLWFVYGVAMVDWPIIVANAITLLLACMILVLKIRDLFRTRNAIKAKA
ncbi:SemiSWEET transporter [Vibrio sp. 404]|uniref:SemiSWEET transporter n=1 Tax=Vibrio marinisediminis TaxID=2758441 RepID=A0A7W2FQR2_9VIBR|nr:SemiSWEET transporter [Vibrio marinisediminis]MBA5762417.1 SemiSWEET transporter [Vibrio marinisediminis]